MRLLVVAMIGTLGLGICSAQNDVPKPLDLCTVVNKIQSYHRQRVRITAYLGTGGEASGLYDPKCDSADSRIYVSYKDGLFKSKEKAPNELERITQKNRYALVTVEGIVYGPEPVEIDPNYPDWLKERMKGSMKRYGHQNMFAMMIEVDRILDAREASDGVTPTPKSN